MERGKEVSKQRKKLRPCKRCGLKFSIITELNPKVYCSLKFGITKLPNGEYSIQAENR